MFEEGHPVFTKGNLVFKEGHPVFKKEILRCAEDKPAASAEEKPGEFAEGRPVVSAEDKPIASTDKISAAMLEPRGSFGRHFGASGLILEPLLEPRGSFGRYFGASLFLWDPGRSYDFQGWGLLIHSRFCSIVSCQLRQFFTKKFTSVFHGGLVLGQPW